jgi:hypothetical protein
MVVIREMPPLILIRTIERITRRQWYDLAGIAGSGGLSAFVARPSLGSARGGRSWRMGRLARGGTSALGRRSAHARRDADAARGAEL